MMGWSITHCSAAGSFGVKLLLLGATVGALFLGGWLEPPSRPAQSETGSLRQAGAETSSGQRSDERAVPGAPAGRVDINRGSADELQSLPGIGPVLAERIVQYRTDRRLFLSIQDIQQVKGIGVKRFAQLRSHIYVDRTTTSSTE